MKVLRPCRVAIVGAGYTAREHIRAFADVPDVIIVGIYSRTRSRAEALAVTYGILRVCESIGELYDKTEADLVVVTVPEMAMNSVSRACFEFPWTVMLEKPAGYNVPDAEEICVDAQQKSRKVLIALNRRFYHSSRSVLSELQDQDGPRFIKVQDQENQQQALSAGQPRSVVDNWMYANSIHVIDYLRFFGRGKIKHVQPVIPWNPEKPGIVIARIEFADGDIGLYEGVWNGPGPWAVNVTTAAKRWELRPLEQAARQNLGERHLQPLATNEWDQTFKPGFRLQAEMAVMAALGQPSESVTIGDALETMRLIQAIFTTSI